MTDLREAAVTFLAIVVAVALVVLALFAAGACTLHVVVRTEPVARAVPMDAPEQHPSLYGLPMTDAGPCGYAITSLAVNGCTSGTYYIDASANVIPVVRQANCENAGDVFEDCW